MRCHFLSNSAMEAWRRIEIRFMAPVWATFVACGRSCPAASVQRYGPTGPTGPADGVTRLTVV